MKIHLITLLLLIALLPISNAENPILDFYEDENFSVYLTDSAPHINASYSFSAKYDTGIQISFVLLQEELESGEWIITFILDDVVKNNTEISPGVFISNETPILNGLHELEIIAKAKPNVIPGNYNYAVTLLSEDVVIASSKKSRGGGGSSTFPDPTPTPMPNQTAVVGDSDITPTPTPTPINITAEQIQEPSKFSWWVIIAIILVLLALFLIRALIKRSKNKDNQP